MDKTKIDWATASWNPITGCFHDCKYCYARTIAHRFTLNCGNTGKIHALNEPFMIDNSPGGDFDTPQYVKDPYPYEFDPTFHRYHLDKPQHWKKPRNIFTVSMGDMFGDWVPDEWIQSVFEACEAAPWHNYIFLTKNPKLYNTLTQGIPTGKNFWYGSTITTMNDIFAYRNASSECNYFLSIEPIQERIFLVNCFLDGLSWVIIGAETGNRKNKVIPRREWVAEIVDQCKAAGVPVFMKSSLAGIWGEPLIQEYPPPLLAVAMGMN